MRFVRFPGRTAWRHSREDAHGIAVPPQLHHPCHDPLSHATGPSPSNVAAALPERSASSTASPTAPPTASPTAPPTAPTAKALISADTPRLLTRVNGHPHLLKLGQQGVGFVIVFGRLGRTSPQEQIPDLRTHETTDQLLSKTTKRGVEGLRSGQLRGSCSQWQVHCP